VLRKGWFQVYFGGSWCRLQIRQIENSVCLSMQARKKERKKEHMERTVSVSEHAGKKERTYGESFIYFVCLAIFYTINWSL